MPNSGSSVAETSAGFAEEARARVQRKASTIGSPALEAVMKQKGWIDADR